MQLLLEGKRRQGCSGEGRNTAPRVVRERGEQAAQAALFFPHITNSTSTTTRPPWWVTDWTSGAPSASVLTRPTSSMVLGASNPT